MAEPILTVEHLVKGYGENTVLDDVSFSVRPGEVVVVVGPSGCGKTTLLKMINKLNSIDSGDILIDSTSVSEIPVSELPKKIGYVVQEGGLFPHMTVGENIALTIKMAGFTEERVTARTNEMLEMVALEPGSYRGLYPSQLSGGQRQRVGVARAFAPDPPIILMDEPFSALDPITRGELQDEVFKLQKQTRKTVVFVTHDMDEAIKLADRICVI